MLNGNAVAASRQELLFRAEDVTRLRRDASDDDSAPRSVSAGPWPTLQSDHIRHGDIGMLLDQCREALRQQSAMQGIADGDGPTLMEVVEQVGIDSSPVVDRHGVYLQ